MITSILMDLDNTLIALGSAHYEALNAALREVDPAYEISLAEHVSTYDALSTRKKLSMLVKAKGFREDKIEQVFARKQFFTMEFIKNSLKPDLVLRSTLEVLAKKYRLFVVSNSIRETIEEALKALGIRDLFEGITSNNDVTFPKPAPFIYLHTLLVHHIEPHEAIVVEDAPHGITAGLTAGLHVCSVTGPHDITVDKIEAFIQSCPKPNIKYPGKGVINIVVPASGLGSRFKNAGYKDSKPFINVLGKFMLQHVVESLNIDAHYIFILQESDVEKYHADIVLPLIAPHCTIVTTKGLTEGAACSVLLAKQIIDNDCQLVIANSDQRFLYNSLEFFHKMNSWKADGGLLTFEDLSQDKKWSFCKTDENGNVLYVREKDSTVGPVANTGLYWFKKGSDFVKAAEQMIAKNIRANNEFYIAPVYNEMIEDQKLIKHVHCEGFIGLGTPEDLENYVESMKK